MAKPYPSGGIPLIEAQWSHREFVTAVTPDYVLAKITSARQLLKRGETAESYFPAETAVITTTTIPDEKLNLLSWERELEIVEEFGPDYHVPTDYSTYEEQPADDRLANVERCMEGTVWMAHQIREREIDTMLIPLINGCSPEEWAICYEVLDRCAFEFPMVSYFSTQYFTGGAGIRVNELVADVREIATRQPRSIVLIGLLSPTYLRRMPRTVRAGTGLNQWRQPISPRKQTGQEMRSIWKQVSDKVSDALEQPRATDYTPSTSEEVA